MSDQEIAELHPFVPAWQIVAEEGIRKLRNTFLFDEEKAAELFLRYLEELSGKENHHPNVESERGRVTVSWWTHSLRDLHPNDFIMAGKTEGAYSLATVGAKGDMFTDEPLPALADVPRFWHIHGRWGKRRPKVS